MQNDAYKTEDTIKRSPTLPELNKRCQTNVSQYLQTKKSNTVHMESNLIVDKVLTSVSVCFG